MSDAMTDHRGEEYEYYCVFCNEKHLKSEMCKRPSRGISIDEFEAENCWNEESEQSELFGMDVCSQSGELMNLCDINHRCSPKLHDYVDEIIATKDDRIAELEAGHEKYRQEVIAFNEKWGEKIKQRDVEYADLEQQLSDALSGYHLEIADLDNKIIDHKLKENKLQQQIALANEWIDAHKDVVRVVECDYKSQLAEAKRAGTERLVKYISQLEYVDDDNIHTYLWREFHIDTEGISWQRDSFVEDIVDLIIEKE